MSSASTTASCLLEDPGLRRDYISNPAAVSGSAGSGSSSSSGGAHNGGAYSADDNGNSDSNSSTSSTSTAAGKCRKPSYVGLSCAISGYSSYVRYQSPSRKTSPSQIHVQTGPQTLDAVLNNYSPVTRTSHEAMRHVPDFSDRRVTPPSRGQFANNQHHNNNNNITDCAEVTTRSSRSAMFTSRTGKIPAMESNIIYTSHKNAEGGANGSEAMREGSPGSDCSGSSSIGSSGSGGGVTEGRGGGNLVAKQIERLYGGRVQAIRVTSPEPKSGQDAASASFDNNNKKGGGGYFTKRLGQANGSAAASGGHDRSSSPLEMKSPLKGPAVFRLLRPEFREQLKNNSCQVRIPSEHQSHLISTTTSVTSTHHQKISNTSSSVTSVSSVSTTPVNPSPFGYRVTTSRQQRERVVPIQKESNGTSNAVADADTPLKSAAMVTRVTAAKDAAAVKERVIPIQLETKSDSSSSSSGASVVTIPIERAKVDATSSPSSASNNDDATSTPVKLQLHNFNNNSINTNTTARGSVASEKPALPAKPSSPPGIKKEQLPLAPDEAAGKETPNGGHVVTSPGLVANCFRGKEALPVADGSSDEEGSSDKTVDNGQSVEEVEREVEEEVEEEEDDYYSRRSPSCGGGGTRERALLCPIQEEDTESTASNTSFASRQTSLVASATVAVPADQPAASATTPQPAAEAGEPTTPLTNGKNRNDREASTEEVHDGHYFIKVLENEIFKFEEQICDFEEELAASDNSSDESKKIPEEVRDSILAANGKAKLLISQKLAQFRGLCDKNINLTLEQDPFRPTSDDLAGFWDMVYIQVEHINALFAELTALRKNGWVSIKPLNTSSSMLNGRRSSPTVKSATSTTPKKASTPTSGATSRKSPASSSTKKSSPGSGGPDTPDSAKKSEAAKARDEARKKMMEERRRMMREKKKELEAAAAAEGSAEVEVFVK